MQIETVPTRPKTPNQRLDSPTFDEMITVTNEFLPAGIVNHLLVNMDTFFAYGLEVLKLTERPNRLRMLRFDPVKNLEISPTFSDMCLQFSESTHIEQLPLIDEFTPREFISDQAEFQRRRDVLIAFVLAKGFLPGMGVYERLDLRTQSTYTNIMYSLINLPAENICFYDGRISPVRLYTSGNTNEISFSNVPYFEVWAARPV